jgi:hypothetical protein
LTFYYKTHRIRRLFNNLFYEKPEAWIHFKDTGGNATACPNFDASNSLAAAQSRGGGGEEIPQSYSFYETSQNFVQSTSRWHWVRFKLVGACVL